MARILKGTTTRRGFLGGSLAAAGWATVSGGWVLRPQWAHANGPIRMGIATDITGPIAPSGNSNWQVAQFAVSRINDAGGILGRPVELFLEDTASDPGTAVGNVRRLIEGSQVDVVLGGITSAMREAIKNPIVRRGRTLYIYPQLYEGRECTEHLFCTGPSPAQQCARLIPYLIEQGATRFAMPSANYIWPQVLNEWAREVIEANGAEVVFEEYFPLDQLEYSSTVARIMNDGVDHVFLTIIPPGLQAFSRQLYEAGYSERGGTMSCVYFDENSVNFVPQRELEGIYSCLDMFHTVDDPHTQELIEGYNEMFPDTRFLFTAGSAATGMYRGIKMYEQAVIATGGDLDRDAVSEAMHGVSIEQGPGGPSEMVPGTGHAKMNMYIAQARDGAWDILSTEEMVDPQECA